jgi:hypothetical protein
MTFVLSTPTLFFPAPIIINIAVHIAMSTVMFVFSEQVFRRGWPDEYWCRNWHSPSPYPGVPDYGPRKDCLDGVNDLRVMMGVSAGVGYLIG